MKEFEDLNIDPGALSCPTDNNREAWKAYWERLNQPWRTEPEISAERQAELTRRRAIPPDVLQGVYPFKGVKLKRADVEWLLATHEQGRGPVDYHDEEQKDREGIDLRGADLSHAQLQNLPLARTIGDAAWTMWSDLTEEQHLMAAVLLQAADLKGAFLEGARLEYAHLQGADLRFAHMEETALSSAHMEQAYISDTNLERSILLFAHLDDAYLWNSRLSGAQLSGARLSGAHLDNMTLADRKGVGPRLADVRWGATNLAVIDWSQVRLLGDEDEARRFAREHRSKKDRTKLLKKYDLAVRANRQLAVELQNQGLNEQAARFRYRAQVLQRHLFRLQGVHKLGSYLFSLFLALLTGYGYRMWRIVIAYILANLLFASLYFSLGLSHAPHISWSEALVLSITAFHGRVFSSPFLPDSPQSIVTACEAITGMIFEGVFVAMLTQRFFSR